MTSADVLRPALVAALALNIIGIIWNQTSSEVPQATSRPPPTAPGSCVEPPGYAKLDQ